jgi:hypothetical protein
MFTAAPCSLVCSGLPPVVDGSGSSPGDWSSSTRTQAVSGLGAPAASRCAASPFSPPSLFPHSPLLFPHGGEHRKGGKPQLNLGLQEGLGPGGIRARSRRCKGKNTAARPGWLVRWGHRRGVTGCGWRRRFWSGCGGHWGLFPLGNPRC